MLSEASGPPVKCGGALEMGIRTSFRR
ncbi:MAG: hypothetical protein QOD41_2359, partial [Cryptosporangiaceae bacterium]|nr:hypothetical protein [Cryptosporangiaceae bacterium]